MLMVVEGAVSNPDNLPMDQIRILVWRESDKAQGAGCRNCRDRRGCLYRANPCPAKAKTGQYPVSGGTRHQHAESSRGKDGFLRYYLGDFASPEEAEAFLQQMKKDPRFRDAFMRPLEELAEQRP